MSVRAVDALLRRYAAPELKAAGFKNHGRTFMADGPRGRQAIVSFTPEVRSDMTAFGGAYGVVTPEHRRFRVDIGRPMRPWPVSTETLVRRKIVSPEEARTGAPPRVGPDRWVLGDDAQNERVGIALRNALVGIVLPQISAWFDPEGMVKAIENFVPGTSFGLAPKPRAMAMALLEVDGADGRLKEQLELLEPDDIVRRWIEQRRASQ